MEFDLKDYLESLSGTKIDSLDLFDQNGELNPFTTGLALGTLFVLVSFSFFLWLLLSKFLGGNKRTGKSLVLMGECGGGKTALFYRLLSPDQDLPQTLSSLKVNEQTTELQDETSSSKTVHLVDVPGSGRLRKLSLFRYSPEARGVVFVVDSALFVSQCRSVGEILREVLMDKNIQRRKVPIMVLCNKQDLLQSIRSDEIQKKLESELDSICQSHLSVPGEEEEEQLVLSGEKFLFDNMENEIFFVESSVKSGDLKAVYSFVGEVFM